MAAAGVMNSMRIRRMCRGSRSEPGNDDQPMPNKLFAIIANTFVETIRQPVYAILLWVAAFWIVFVSPSLAAFSLESGSDNKIMVDVNLSTLLLYGLLVSVFSATAVITREIESQTVLTVISKPVSRPLFLLGKYIGVTGAVLLGYVFLAIAFFMVKRHGVMETASDTFDWPVLVFGLSAVLISLAVALFGNYFYGWHFAATLTSWVIPLSAIALVLVLFLGRDWTPQAPATDFGDFQMVYVIILAFCAVVVLTAFAVTLATRFSVTLTLMLCVGVFLLGLLSDYYFGRHAADVPAYQFLYAVLPNFQFFWLGDAITQEVVIPGSHVVNVLSYSGLYALAVLGLGTALFQTREVG